MACIVATRSAAHPQKFSATNLARIRVLLYPLAFGGPGQRLQRRFGFQGFALGTEFLRGHDALGLVHAHVLGALAFDVLPETPFYVIADAGVPGAAFAFDDVDPPTHRCSANKKWPRTLEVRGQIIPDNVTCGWIR